MLLEHLSICNYGVYAEKNDFDLVTTPEKPIILVGGLNGAGKTTILESMMIAFYGKSYFGIKKPTKEYLDFIYNRIHKSSKTRADYASVEIAFRFYHNNSEDRYVISRSWDVDGASVTESFTVQKNDQKMDDVDESQWQSFIDGLLPLGIAKLFFFDGEKIVRITENHGQYNKEIKESLETLIGSYLVNRLRADLNLYMLRKSDNKNENVINQYDQMSQEKKQISSDIESLVAEHEKKTAEIESVNSKISVKESSISGIGGGYADIRSRLLTEKAVLVEKAKSHEKYIHLELADDAPFYLAPSMLCKIQDKIKTDLDIFYRSVANMSTDTIVPELQKKLSDPKFWPENADGKHLTSKVINAIRELDAPRKEKQFFNIAFDDYDLISHVFKKINGGHKSLSDVIAKYKDTTAQIEKIDSDIIRVPKDDELGPRISEINQLHKEVGMLQGEIMHITQQLSSKRSYVKILQSKLKTMILSIDSGKNVATGVKLASKMQAVLDTYYAKLKETKMRDLESNLLHTARLLLHKESIRKIEIDRDTFEIKAYESGDEQIPGDFLSMGEKQIVGTALLWAIARTCGRSLPFVIDTPLGRLDGQHLLNLTEKFYPFASHQMILLSTDREIGHKEYEKLSKNISKSYRIVCDKDMSVTSVMSGYFAEDKIAQA